MFAGPKYAALAFSLFGRNPRLIPYALLPALAALLASIFGIWAAVLWGGDLLTLIWPAPENTLLFGVWWVLTLVLRISSAILAVFLIPWLVMLVGFPLCEPLAAKADALLGGEAVEVSFVEGLVHTVTSSLGVLLIGLGGAVGLILLGFIPGLGLFTGPFMLFVWTPLFLAYDMCDSGLSRRALGLRARLKWVMARPIDAVSLGLVGALLVAVPLVNLFGLPVAVLAGTIYVRERERKRNESDGRVGAPGGASAGAPGRAQGVAPDSSTGSSTSGSTPR